MMRSVLMKQCDVFEAELSVYYQHHKFVLRAYENTGHFASREGISRDAGHMGRILLATLNARPSISELAVLHSVCDERSVCKLRHWVLSALSLVSASVTPCLTILNITGIKFLAKLSSWLGG